MFLSQSSFSLSFLLLSQSPSLSSLVSLSLSQSLDFFVSIFSFFLSLNFLFSLSPNLLLLFVSPSIFFSHFLFFLRFPLLPFLPCPQYSPHCQSFSVYPFFCFVLDLFSFSFAYPIIFLFFSPWPRSLFSLFSLLSLCQSLIFSLSLLTH